MNPETPAKIVQNYSLENAQLTRLGGADNINFRVDHNGKSYVLRLRTAARHTYATVSSELFWLDSLAGNTSLVVSKPIRNQKNDFVTVFKDDDGQIFSTLMTWIEGKVPPTVDAMTDTQLAKAGSIMAQLHAHSQQVDLPGDFKREMLSADYFAKRLESLNKALNNSEINRDDLEYFKINADTIISNYADLKRSSNSFGLIHADFHSGNYLLYNKEVRIIDFDRCSFGFYLYDLTVALTELNQEQRQHFLQGYEAVKPLPDDYQRLEPFFLTLSYIDNLGFFASNPDELPFITKEMVFVIEALRKAVKAL
jgi:Ser/Thr protein kinase RdoA (MazF antagonist)